MSLYTPKELFYLWRRFRNEPNAPEILSGFACCEIFQACILITEFYKMAGEPIPKAYQKYLEFEPDPPPLKPPPISPDKWDF